VGALVALAGCGGDDPVRPDPTGTVEVSASTTGDDADSDGYTVTLDGGDEQALDPNGSVTFSDVSAGEVSVELSGAADNCSVSGDNPRTVQVEGGQTASVTFDVACSARTGDMTVSASTTGDEQDPDGYSVALDGPSGPDTLSLAINGDTTVTGLDEGDYTVELFDVANSCSVGGENPRTVSVPFDGTGSTTFEVACNQQAGDLEASASTTGEDQDDSYTVEVDGGAQSQDIGPNGTATFTGLAAGSHDVELTGVADNCSVSGDNPRTVDVPDGGTATTSFDVSCSDVPGDLEATASTTGEDLDQDGYTVTVDPGTAGEQSMALAVNDDTATFTDLASEDHQVELSGVRDNCSVVGDNPRTVTVPGAGTAATTFDVECVNRTGDLEVSSSTTGDQPDPDGYLVTVDGPAGTFPDSSIDTNGTEVFSDLDEGDYTVELSDLAANCWIPGDNPRTVSVAFGQTASTTFDVECFAPLSDQVVFDSDRDGGDLDVYVMNPDGTDLTRLTTDAADDRTPAVSPDGTKIVFQSTRDAGTNDLWIMNADGTNPRQLTDANDFNPDWSPMGGFITFQRISSGQADVYFINEDGTQLTNLTPNTTSSDERGPAWSPDGSQIAFDSNRDDDDGDGTNEFDVYVMDNDGSNVTKVTTAATAAEDQHPQWDPSSCGSGDCQRLVFFSDRSGNNGDIFRIQVNGTDEQQLTSDAAPDYQPAYSPDGSTIVFVSERDGNAEIWTMDATDGSGESQVTNTTGVNNKNPDWGPQ
jgi:Tol biopolymer transport system component